MSDTISLPRNSMGLGVKPASEPSVPAVGLQTAPTVEPAKMPVECGGIMPESGDSVLFHQPGGKTLPAILLDFSPIYGTWDLKIFMYGTDRAQRAAHFAPTPTEGCWTWPKKTKTLIERITVLEAVLESATAPKA